MAYVSNEIYLDLLDALNLRGKQVTRINIDFTVNEPVRIMVEYYHEHDDIPKVLEFIKKLDIDGGAHADIE